MRAALFLLLVWLTAMSAHAGDGVFAPGILSDDDFYRLATCGAPPGGDCAGPLVKWSKRKITVALQPAEPGFPDRLVPQADAALNEAIAQINAAGARIQLVRDDGRRVPDIIVTLSALREGEATQGMPRMPDGTVIGVGQYQIWWNDNKRLTGAAVLIASDIKADHLRSVMLEEIFQCLGFQFDVDGPAYNRRSILAQDDNSVVRISGQDRMLLNRSYP